MLANKLKKITREILWILPHRTAHELMYFYQHKRFMHWKNPVTYDEMIHYLSATTYDDSYWIYADKYAVREYVTKCGLGDLLVPLYGVYRNVDEINFSQLPDKYILITNHASGIKNYYICHDKQKVDEQMVRDKLNTALKIRYSRLYLEYQYEKIKPLILCEKLLEDGENKSIDDYKVVCVDGVPQKILVCTQRDNGRDYYSTDWKYLDHVKEEYKSGKLTPKPECLEQMLVAASTLSKPFPLARIDFYVVNGRLYFSEITLVPSAGMHGNLNEKGQLEWRNLN